MPHSNIFQSDLSWFGAEGTKDGAAILIRGRSVTGTDVTRGGLPFALELTLAYEPADALALPTPAQYERITEFEGRVIDAMESARIGVATLIETCRGSVTYLLYLADGDAAVGRLNQFVRDADAVEFAGDDDPDWKRYASKMRRIRPPSDEA